MITSFFCDVNIASLPVNTHLLNLDGGEGLKMSETDHMVFV